MTRLLAACLFAAMAFSPGFAILAKAFSPGFAILAKAAVARAEVPPEPPPVDSPRLAPEPAVSPSAADAGEPAREADGPWAIELSINAEPEQPRDVPCNRGNDCLTGAKVYFGGAMRGAYRDPETWSVVATLGLTTFVDQEERPPSYTALTLRTDLQVELGRGPDRFGAALRVSPVLVVAWAEPGVDVLSDVPGFALVLGTDTLWGEAGVRTVTTPSDPRGFHLAFGFVHERWSGTTGIATFSTLGFREGDVAPAGGTFGVYGDVTMRVTERFDLRVMAVISAPVLVSLGFGWRFAQ